MSVGFPSYLERMRARRISAGYGSRCQAPLRPKPGTYNSTIFPRSKASTNSSEMWYDISLKPRHRRREVRMIMAFVLQLHYGDHVKARSLKSTWVTFTGIPWRYALKEVFCGRRPVYRSIQSRPPVLGARERGSEHIVVKVLLSWVLETSLLAPLITILTAE